MLKVLGDTRSKSRFCLVLLRRRVAMRYRRSEFPGSPNACQDPTRWLDLPSNNEPYLRRPRHGTAKVLLNLEITERDDHT
jgi:hypothetical protein